MSSTLASHASNAGVLRYLAGGADAATVSVERPTGETDTWRLGAHPDVVEHLWTRLNAALPEDARVLIAGGAALAHPDSGAILALALGTRYAIRLSADGFAQAVARGHETRHHFVTVGRSLDLSEVFGAGWVFGRYDDSERDWLIRSYEEVGA